MIGRTLLMGDTIGLMGFARPLAPIGAPEEIILTEPHGVHTPERNDEAVVIHIKDGSPLQVVEKHQPTTLTRIHTAHEALQTEVSWRAVKTGGRVVQEFDGVSSLLETAVERLALTLLHNTSWASYINARGDEASDLLNSLVRREVEHKAKFSLPISDPRLLEHLDPETLVDLIEMTLKRIKQAALHIDELLELKSLTPLERVSLRNAHSFLERLMAQAALLDRSRPRHPNHLSVLLRRYSFAKGDYMRFVETLRTRL